MTATDLQEVTVLCLDPEEVAGKTYNIGGVLVMFAARATPKKAAAPAPVTSDGVTLASRLRLRKGEKAWTVRRMAEIAGCCQSTVYRMLAGHQGDPEIYRKLGVKVTP